MVLTGDLASHDEARKVEKSWVPNNNFAPFFMALTSNFFLMCQALFI